MLPDLDAEHLLRDGRIGTVLGVRREHVLRVPPLVLAALALAQQRDGLRVIKTDADGDTIWTKHFGENQNYYIQSGLELPGIGYIILGYTKADAADPEEIWLAKTDLNGETIWTKTFGGSDRDLPHSISQTGDGGFIISGSTKTLSAGDFDAWLIRTDSDGNLIWSKKYGGTGYDLGWDAEQTNDDGCIVAGLTASFGHMNNYVDAWLIKTDHKGDTLWTKTYGVLDHDGALSVRQTSD